MVGAVEELGEINDAFKKIEETIYGNEDLAENNKTPKVWTDGHINLEGKVITPSTYRVSEFIKVSRGDTYKVYAGGSKNVLIVSSYTTNEQSSFLTDAASNIVGVGSLKEYIVTIPDNVDYIRLTHNEGTESISVVYLKKVVDSISIGLVKRVEDLEISDSGVGGTEFKMRRGAVFSIMADDALNTDPLALSIANKHNIPLSFAIQTSNIGNNGIEFYKNAYKNGSSILSNTVTHSVTQNEIINSKLILKEHGFPTNGYISPGGGTNANLLPVLNRYYGYANSLPNTFVEPLDDAFIAKFNQNVDPSRLTRIGLEGCNTNIKDCSKIFEIIDFSIENNLLMLMYIHAMPSTYKNNDGTSVLTTDNMDTICAYLADKRENYYCKVLNVDNAIREYYNYKDFIKQ